MSSTQDHLSIADIKEDIVMLKDGGAALVLETNAVNFGLLSDKEQIAIIGAFAQMLNSLSFSIQIVIHSKRLDISSYLILLDNALKVQTNPLLAQLMSKYRQFIQGTIKENDVLDKNFYVVIYISSFELGIGLSGNISKFQKAKTSLMPRRDQVMRQLSRIGLRAIQLNTNQLIQLYYNIYNQQADEITPIDIPPVTLAPAPQPASPLPPPISPPPLPNNPPQSMQFQTNVAPIPPQRVNNQTPFMVEELTDKE